MHRATWGNKAEELVSAEVRLVITAPLKAYEGTKRPQQRFQLPTQVQEEKKMGELSRLILSLVQWPRQFGVSTLILHISCYFSLSSGQKGKVDLGKKNGEAQIFHIANYRHSKHTIDRSELPSIASICLSRRWNPAGSAPLDATYLL